MKIGIAGIGIIGPWGDDLKEYNKNLKSKISAISPITRFETTDLSVHAAAQIHDFDPFKYILKKNNHKYDTYSRLSIASSKLALESGSKEWTPAEREDMGISYATDSQAEIIAEYLTDLFQKGPEGVSPRLFSRAAANSTGCNIAMELGLKGISLNTSAKFASGFQSLYNAVQIIRAQQGSEVIAGSVDYLSRSLLEIYDKIEVFKKSPEDEMGADFPGEGSVSILLSETDNTFGTIHNIIFLSSGCPTYRWPTDVDVQVNTLKKALGDHTVEQYFTSANGDKNVKNLDTKAFDTVFKDYRPEVISIKELVGEFSGVTLLQVYAACMAPAGVKSLISVIGPGGIHGAILVESHGRNLE